MLIIHPDVSITRRKHFHLIENDQGETDFRNRLFGPVLDEVWTRERPTFIIRTARFEYLMLIQEAWARKEND